MTAQELHEIVENIVSRVMQRIERDSELIHLIDVSKSGANFSSASGQSSDQSSSHSGVAQKQEKKLYVERDILELARKGGKVLVVSNKTIFTPSALDAARKKGINITRE
jgi:hypothetical protein